MHVIEEEKKVNWIISRQVGLNLVVPGGTKTIDAMGKLVMPGWSLERDLFSFFFTYRNCNQAVLIHTLIWNCNLWVQEQQMIFIRVLEQLLLVEQRPFVRIAKEKKNERDRERKGHTV